MCYLPFFVSVSLKSLYPYESVWRMQTFLKSIAAEEWLRTIAPMHEKCERISLPSAPRFPKGQCVKTVPRIFSLFISSNINFNIKTSGIISYKCNNADSLSKVCANASLFTTWTDPGSNPVSAMTDRRLIAWAVVRPLKHKIHVINVSKRSSLLHRKHS
jgi:hypothetical protein